jgi:hypothetical protein
VCPTFFHHIATCQDQSINLIPDIQIFWSPHTLHYIRSHRTLYYIIFHVHKTFRTETLPKKERIERQQRETTVTYSCSIVSQSVSQSVSQPKQGLPLLYSTYFEFGVSIFAFVTSKPFEWKFIETYQTTHFNNICIYTNNEQQQQNTRQGKASTKPQNNKTTK